MSNTHTHPAMASALATFLPTPPAETFRATCGRRRVYLSQADVDAYARGYHAYPAKPEGPIGTPEWSGWLDADLELHRQLEVCHG